MPDSNPNKRSSLGEQDEALLRVGVESPGNTDALEDYMKILREKILFGLEIYPAISPTMLHTFLGTATSTHVWKPILNDLIAEGLVERTEVTLTSPHERVQTYTILHRTDKAYSKPVHTLDAE